MLYRPRIKAYIYAFIDVRCDVVKMSLFDPTRQSNLYSCKSFLGEFENILATFYLDTCAAPRQVHTSFIHLPPYTQNVNHHSFATLMYYITKAKPELNYDMSTITSTKIEQFKQVFRYFFSPTL